MNKIFFSSLGLLFFGVYVHSMEINPDHAALQARFAQELLLDGIKLGNAETMNQAIARGANVNLPCKKSPNLTPLGIAIENKNLKSVQLLLEHGADPNIYAANIYADRGEEKLALCEAIYFGLQYDNLGYALFSLLLQHGAHLEADSATDKSKSPYYKILELMGGNLGLIPLANWDNGIDTLKSGLKIGLLGLDLLDKNNNRLERAIELSAFDASVKNIISEGKKTYDGILNELDQEIKEDLEQKEQEYASSVFVKNRKPLLNELMSSQFTGKLFHRHTHNTLDYHGKTYLVSKNLF